MTTTTDNGTQRRGRPPKYANDDERRAARATEARVRRLQQKSGTAKRSADPRGRPPKYHSDEERKAARAAAARKRRAALKAKGFKEIRKLVPIHKDNRPTSSILDLSTLYHNKRDL